MNQKAKEHLDKLMEVAAEEIAKAVTDRIFFGKGVVKITDDGTVEHVPYLDIPDDLSIEDFISGVSSNKRGTK